MQINSTSKRNFSCSWSGTIIGSVRSQMSQIINNFSPGVRAQLWVECWIGVMFLLDDRVCTHSRLQTWANPKTLQKSFVKLSFCSKLCQMQLANQLDKEAKSIIEFDRCFEYFRMRWNILTGSVIWSTSTLAYLQPRIEFYRPSYSLTAPLSTHYLSAHRYPVLFHFHHLYHILFLANSKTGSCVIRKPSEM